MQIDPKVNKLLWVVNGLFLLLFGILAFNNRLAVDDYYLLARVNELGVFGAVEEMYLTWNTRWIALTISYTALLFNGVPHFLFAFGLLQLGAITFATYFMIKQYFKYILHAHMRPIEIGGFALFFINLFFLSSVGIADTWFWLTTSPMYLLSIAALLGVVGFLLNDKRNMESYVWTGFLSFLIGAMTGPLAMIVILTSAVLWGLTKATKFKIGMLYVRPLLSKFTIIFVCCGLSFLTLALGEGAHIRKAALPETSLLAAIFINIKSLGILYLLKFPIKILVLMLMSIPTIFISSATSYKDEFKGLQWKLMGQITIIYIVVVFLQHWPIAYVMGDLGPDRSLAPISLYTVVYFSMLAYLIGKHPLFEYEKRKKIMSAALVVCMCVNGYHIVNQAMITSKYASAVDQRIDFLTTHSTDNKIVFVEPLPPSGMLYSSEITGDTAIFPNQHLKAGLDLPFAVQLKQSTK